MEMNQNTEDWWRTLTCGARKTTCSLTSANVLVVDFWHVKETARSGGEGGYGAVLQAPGVLPELWIGLDRQRQCTMP